jgi:hypothetical protein
MAEDRSYALLQGKVYMATRLANGAQNGGLIDIGDCDKVDITTTQKFDDIEESRTGARNVAAHIAIGTTMAVKVNMLQLSRDNIAIAYMGNSSGPVTGAAVSSEPVTLYNDAVTPLAHPNVSAVTVSVGTVDVDWVIDADSGFVRVLPGSSAVPAGAGVAATVNYTFATYTGSVQAFMKPITEYFLVVSGINTANGSAPFLGYFYRVSIDLAKTLAMIDSKHAMLEIDGMLLPDATAPTGRSPWFTIVKS